MDSLATGMALQVRSLVAHFCFLLRLAEEVTEAKHMLQVSLACSVALANSSPTRPAPLQACRTALEKAGWEWKLESGAHVFVHPEQSALAFHDLQFCLDL